MFVPELPEVFLVWSERLVFSGPCVSSAISHPDVVAGVGEHVAQTGVGQVGDPVAAGSQEAVLEEHRRPWTCRTQTRETSRDHRCDTLTRSVTLKQL